MTEYEVSFFRQFEKLVSSIQRMADDIGSIKTLLQETRKSNTQNDTGAQGVSLQVDDIVVSEFFGKYSVEQVMALQELSGQWKCISYDMNTLEEAKQLVKDNFPNTIEIKDELLNRYIYRKQ